jgi:hypothetical protein
MATEIDYGNLTKRIVFTDNDHRHAKFLVRLRYDNMTQSNFFRNIISAYIDGDERIQSFIDEVKQQSLKQKASSRRLRNKGNKKATELGLSNDEVDNIFDTLEQEFPDL